MDRKKGAVLAAGYILFYLCGLTGCGQVENETDEMIILEQEPEEEESGYALAVAAIDDIKIVQKIECVYQQADDEELSFKISGKKIEKIYVEEGDRVKKGQVVAELALGDIDARLAEIQYQLERNQILLRQVQEDESLTIERMENTKDESSMTDEQKKSYAKSLADIRQDYKYQIEDYQDTIAVLNQRLFDLLQEKNQQYLYAGMSGTVAYVKENLEGTSTIANEKVMTIMDVRQCTFCSDQIEYADYFTENQPVEIQISGRSDSCTVIPYQRNSWDDTMQFVFEDESENQNMSVGAMGNISLVLEEQEQVLTLPSDAVHEADGKAYVYVMGENNIWETKWITVGLEGKDKVEITSGLSEGDMVILK